MKGEGKEKRAGEVVFQPADGLSVALSAAEKREHPQAFVARSCREEL